MSDKFVPDVAYLEIPELELRVMVLTDSRLAKLLRTLERQAEKEKGKPQELLAWEMVYVMKELQARRQYEGIPLDPGSVHVLTVLEPLETTFGGGKVN